MCVCVLVNIKFALDNECRFDDVAQYSLTTDHPTF